jgi:ACT domain-containing protein
MMRSKLLVKISITALDKPKVLRDILSILANLGANVQAIAHDRCTTAVPVGYVNLVITFQTLGKEQIDVIRQELDSKKVVYHLLN